MPKLSLNASKKTKHTHAGEIPVDWGWSKIGALGKVQTGRQKSPSFIKGTVRPYLRVANVFEGRLSLDDVKSMKFTDAEYNQFLLKDGDILLNEGQSLELVGRAAMYKGLPADCCFQNTLIRFQAGESITPEFSLCLFHYFLHSGKFAAIASQTTSIAHLGTSRFAALPAPVPPLPEQRRIADILSTWDRAIETLESLIAAKERRKQALMEQLLSGRKRLPGFTGKWPTTHLGKLAENVSIRNNGKLGWDRLYAVTKANGMIPMREQVMGISTNNCKVMKRDDFAYNPMRLNIGSLARWQGDEDVMVSGDYIVFRCNEGELDPRYFDHLRRSEHWNQFVNVGGSGSVRVRLYFKDIAPFQIRCPSFKEQQAIAAILDTADRELNLHRQHLATLRTQKRGLMKLLLTGAVRTKI